MDDPTAPPEPGTGSPTNDAVAEPQGDGQPTTPTSADVEAVLRALRAERADHKASRTKITDLTARLEQQATEHVTALEALKTEYETAAAASAAAILDMQTDNLLRKFHVGEAGERFIRSLPTFEEREHALKAFGVRRQTKARQVIGNYPSTDAGRGERVVEDVPLFTALTT